MKGFSPLRSNELQDIMNKPEGWVLKWGTLFLMFFVVFIIVCSCLIKYPDKREIVLMPINENSNIDIYAPHKGIIKSTNICNGDYVEENDTLIIYGNYLDSDLSDVIISPINGTINFPKVRSNGTVITTNELLFMIEPYKTNINTSNLMYGYINEEVRKQINKETEIKIKIDNVLENCEIVNIANIANEDNLYYMEVKTKRPLKGLLNEKYNAEIIISDIPLINKVFDKWR